MATGYTHAVKDGTTDFRHFVWKCAEAFFHHGDLPRDLEVRPAEFYAQNVRDDAERVRRYEAMTVAEAREDLETYQTRRRCEDKTDRILRYQEARRYQDMIDSVRAWQVPTPEHQDLKDFMLDQLQESLDFDCNPRVAPKDPEQTPESWRQLKLDLSQERLARSQEYLANEERRCAETTAWLRALQASVPRP